MSRTAFPRSLSSEILDGLAGDDPQAIRSRQDLRRINLVMRSASIIAGALGASEGAPKRIIELGAGDGTLMLRLARRYAFAWPGVHLTLLDRQQLVSAATRDAFRKLGWELDVLQAELADWMPSRSRPRREHWDICIANLFIHHFDDRQIAALFEAMSACTDLLIACEPRRGHFPLFASRLVGLLGANAVTREDAVLSVRAGFCATELSALWPAAPRWRLEEEPAGWFSHRFVARRLKS